MQSVKSQNTKPELLVRKTLHSLGYRYRLHAGGLPGTPDIVLATRKVAIFVHGCFWHRHDGCRHASTPKTRRQYWERKFLRNIARDLQSHQQLVQADWLPIVIWECELRSSDWINRLVTQINSRPYCRR